MKEEKDWLFWEYCHPQRESFRFDDNGVLMEVLPGMNTHLIRELERLHNAGSVKDSR